MCARCRVREILKPMCLELQASDAAVSDGSKRMSITHTLSSLVSKFAGVFQKGEVGGGAFKDDSEDDEGEDMSNPFGADGDEDDVFQSETAEDEDHGTSATEQLAVLDNLLTVSTSNSNWMRKAEQSIAFEEENYLDLKYEGWQVHRVAVLQLRRRVRRGDFKTSLLIMTLRLMKRGKLGRDMKTIRPRYFVLRRGALKYYEHENDQSQEIGRVQLSHTTQVLIHPDHPRMLEIRPGDNFFVAVRCDMVHTSL